MNNELIKKLHSDFIRNFKYGSISIDTLIKAFNALYSIDIIKASDEHYFHIVNNSLKYFCTASELEIVLQCIIETLKLSDDHSAFSNNWTTSFYKKELEDEARQSFITHMYLELSNRSVDDIEFYCLHLNIDKSEYETWLEDNRNDYPHIDTQLKIAEQQKAQALVNSEYHKNLKAVFFTSLIIFVIGYCIAKGFS